ncbi:hypothetical protein GQ53DRAFT_123838 [Thozetella sp. PMI_491]|nr:hypothetical protein GQ53DRAFT_123838 [Thozetella sp. PMI_491]
MAQSKPKGTERFKKQLPVPFLGTGPISGRGWRLPGQFQPIAASHASPSSAYPKGQASRSYLPLRFCVLEPGLVVCLSRLLRCTGRSVANYRVPRVRLHLSQEPCGGVGPGWPWPALVCALVRAHRRSLHDATAGFEGRRSRQKQARPVLSIREALLIQKLEIWGRPILDALFPSSGTRARDQCGPPVCTSRSVQYGTYCPRLSSGKA